jgi:L-lactate dehydrogenase complex protein LldF
VVVDRREELLTKLKGALNNRESSEKMWSSMARVRGNSAESIQKLEVNVHGMKEKNHRLKTLSLADPSLVDRFAEQVRGNGGRVAFARDGKEAIDYVLNVARRLHTDLIIKAKSITSEEIDFNQELARDGIQCIETDLGELIVQLADQRPVHIVAPAAHLSVQDIAEIVNDKLHLGVPPEHQAILRKVRAYLRPIFLSARIGVTGGNIGVADTGTVIIESNEGNARLVSTAPQVHIVLIGREKIVPSWDGVAGLIEGHALSATGQKMTVYVTALTEHLPLAGGTDGREFHVVILDNGRSKMLKDEWFSEALDCIRCGACMNVCPTYSVVGGHVFGYIYPGPIGIPWTEEIHGLDKAAFSHLCVSCGLCKEACPVDIDIPMMIAKVKQKDVDTYGQLRVNSFFSSSETLARLASYTAPLSNWAISSSPSRFLMEWLFGVDRRRSLPPFQRRRLRSMLAGIPDGNGMAGKVVFFPDIYADYNDPALGLKAVRILRSAGFRVVVPELRWSGMPYLSYGEVRKATKVAAENLEILMPYVMEGYSVVSTEPTANYMLRGPYRKLVPGPAAESVAASTYPFFEFIEKELPRLGLSPTQETSSEIGFHIPCHDRGLTSGRAAIAFLTASGYKVKVVEDGTCCGMAGTFGMKHGPLGYDLSMAVGENLFSLFRQSGCRLVATESSVCSTQINDGTGLKVLHPLQMADVRPSS